MRSAPAGHPARLLSRRPGVALSSPITIAVILAGVSLARPASGQLCHVPAPTSDLASRGTAAGDATTSHATQLTAALSVEAANLDSGDLQGLTPSLAWQRGRFSAHAAAPTYRLAHLTGDAWGPGDVTVGGRARIITVRGDTVSAQAGVMTTLGLPTGDADHGLGMGHAMIMPGAWITTAVGAWSLATSASLGASLGDGHHHHMPLVNPMNSREVGGSARAGYTAGALELHGIGAVAVPIGDGITRAIAGAGLRWSLGAWSVGAEAEAGLAGRPFITRGVLDAARTF